MTQGHTHDFTEVLSTDDGLTRRCQCGARLWEPADIALRFAGGNVVRQGGRLVFKKRAVGEQASSAKEG